MSIHLVTGATGYLGQRLVRALLEKGDTVGALVRGDPASAVERAHQLFPDYSSRYGNRFLVFSGDVTLEDLGLGPSITSLARYGDLSLWHLAADLSFKEADREAVMKTNVDGTRNVVRFANRYASRLYYMSTPFVCGDTRKTFREDQLEVSQRFWNWYERSKYEAEIVVREECRAPFVVFRPSIIVGDACEAKASTCTFGYYRVAFMFYMLKRWLVGVMQSGPAPIRLALRVIGTRYDPSADVLYAAWLTLPYPRGSTVDLVHIEDVVRAMVAVPTLGVPSGTTFHLTQPNPPTFHFLLRSFLSDVRLEGVKTVGLPPPLFRLVVKGLNYLIPPFRPYLRFILKYLPYVSHNHKFSLRNTKAYPLLLPGPMTREKLREINRHAVEDVFRYIQREHDSGSKIRGKERAEPVERAPLTLATDTLSRQSEGGDS